MVKSVAVVGAGASGAITASALKAEDCFEKIRVFERRSTAGGTWNFDADPGHIPFEPGALPTSVDPPLPIPSSLPQTRPQSMQNRFDTTPVYEGLRTNVPDVAMSFTDMPFAYGTFVPYWVPRQYVESYFAWHRTDGVDMLSLQTTVESVERLEGQRWRLILRKHDASRELDEWWEEVFDAVVIANGHYSVPFVPAVEGLSEYVSQFPGRVQHSKSYRSPKAYKDQTVLVIGTSASGYDISHQLLQSNIVKRVYVSRRTKPSWEPKAPPEIHWLPIITSYQKDGSIIFADDTILYDIDKVIYCTGYNPSYPFWRVAQNGRPLYDYQADRLINNYQHTFISDFPTLTFVGLPRVLTFRSLEYQAVAIARKFAGRNARPLPPIEEQRKWLVERTEERRREQTKFHQIDWDTGETVEWYRWLYEFAGLPSLEGHGRCPPVLDARTRWAVEHSAKCRYPERCDSDSEEAGTETREQVSSEWDLLNVSENRFWFL